MPLGKPVAKRYFTITEVSDMLGLNASMLRYWEKEFRQLNPRTNARGKRFYTERDIATIQEIHRLVKLQGFTLDGARKALSGREIPEPEPLVMGDSPASDAVSGPERQEVLDRLRAVRARLAALQEATVESR
jgi:DNA-binding transcriptional MerR regulator